MRRYNPKDIEPKWQKIWEENGTYTADLNSDKPKYIAMSMFNYPSGAGIHIGHAMNYTISDVKARFKRQQGYESYHPVGWDAFGLPAENYAIKAGVSPQESMATIIPSYHKQYKAMGWSNDWKKEISTHLPQYYKWTQWIFSQMHKNNLAYQDVRMQWWCEKCQTVLANEQVIDGKCWRHDSFEDGEVQKKEVKQWFFKITEYAEELLAAIDSLDWTESVKLAQKNWIGKSIGAEIKFKLVDTKQVIDVFTTRPDTIYGATFMVLAPEHNLVKEIVTDTQKSEVEQYIKIVQKKSEVERQSSNKKTGVFTGSYAINPANNEKIPIWIADYVLTGYGTGAIMAVPAHDERDYEFAQKFDLSITQVIEPETGEPQANSEFRNSVVVIVRNQRTNQVLTIDWGKQGGILFIGGGIDDQEDVVEAARREVAEETGYTHLTYVSQTGPIHHNYFAYSKNTARRIEAHAILFDLVDETSQDTELEENERGNFFVNWVDINSVDNLIKDELHKLSFEQLIHGSPYTGEGIMFNSGVYGGMSSSEAREKITDDLVKKGVANEKINYKMRDWSVSRQRYWGAPIPVINCQKCGPLLVPDNDLPVLLPELEDFKPSGDGRSALARAEDWLKVKCPNCNDSAERETDTLDTYIDSSWYMYRYFDPHNQQTIFNNEVVKKWEPIDFYNGADHATAHLLYARFIARFFKKIGLVNEPEPFKQFLFNGKVMAQDGTMFSKSKGNGVDPLEIINQGYGADALRTYLMFAAPLELGARWDPQGVPGTYRFLSRLWNIVQEYLLSADGETEEKQKKAMLRTTHFMIKKVSQDIEENHYNTAIATLMSALNEIYKLKIGGIRKSDVWQQALECIVACTAPFAPHISEELWHQLGHKNSIHTDSWPVHNEEYLVSQNLIIIVQINGRVRANIEISATASQEEIEAAAKTDPKISAYIVNKTIQKIIYIDKKLINIVV